jgi:hypothetical protein
MIIDNGALRRHYWRNASLALDQFDSVDQFLRQAIAAKDGKREAISKSISPGLQDHGTVGIPPKLAASIEAMLQKHGDETYRQIALFCLGKWFELHIGMFEELIGEEPSMACSCLMDATRIADSLHLLSEINSIGGDGGWKPMLEETLSQHILEELEEECR